MKNDLHCFIVFQGDFHAIYLTSSLLKDKHKDKDWDNHSLSNKELTQTLFILQNFFLHFIKALVEEMHNILLADLIQTH